MATGEHSRRYQSAGRSHLPLNTRVSLEFTTNGPDIFDGCLALPTSGRLKLTFPIPIGNESCSLLQEELTDQPLGNGFLGVRFSCPRSGPRSTPDLGQRVRIETPKGKKQCEPHPTRNPLNLCGYIITRLWRAGR